jgi:ABC-type polar amino acid transport system ATPase subunit
LARRAEREHDARAACLAKKAAEKIAREIGDQLVFMDGGVIVERGAPREMIADLRSPRTREFLSWVL